LTARSARADLRIPYLDIMLRQISLRGCFMYPRDVPSRLVSLVRAGAIDLARLATKVFPLAEFEAALQGRSTSD
jgi:alcohol dehydrogenase